MHYTATYSPEDNKLRLYATARLPAEVYARVKAAGFVWAPKQELFVAPIWTPEREDLLTDLTGEIDDEDTSLVERQEERAERFGEYQEKRADDAERAHAAVAQVADAIPLGQPILVGHHSQHRAERDAERIENGMRKAVRMWQTAEYWKDRAAGAIRHAKYKELPAVRARRIKGLEAERRKHEKDRAELERLLRFWSGTPTREEALRVCNYFDRGGVVLATGETYWSAWGALSDGTTTVDELKAQRLARLPGMIAYRARWVAHLDNRLTYERAMLAESGGTATDRVRPEKGGACRCWCSPGHGRGWSVIRKVNRVSVTVLDNWGTRGRDFTRTIPFDQLKAVMSAAEVVAKRAAGLVAESENGVGFYLLDSPLPAPREKPAADAQAEKFAALAEALREGVKVVSAPNLFPTPPEIARRVVELADIQPGQRILEPSAGTGSLVRAIQEAHEDADITAVEINPQLAAGLSGMVQRCECADFLTLGEDLGEFDRIVMNPPFDHGADIDHIRHAFALLAPGGRLVAVCANGPRQREELGEVCTQWIDLPTGSFKEQGTGVNTAIVVLDN
jgi:protein-L-isoaspartate O-methyltransferase